MWIVIQVYGKDCKVLNMDNCYTGMRKKDVKEPIPLNRKMVIVTQ